MTPRNLALALVLTMAATGSVQAQTMDSAPVKGPVFLTRNMLKPQFILPAPPAEGSPEAVAEMAEVKAITGTVSTAVRDSASTDGATENASYLADTVPGLDLAKLPATKKLFDEVRTDENFEAKTFKAYFARRRPYQVDPAIQTCKSEEPSKTPASYPSGHATMGYSMAVVMANLVPEKAAQIMARAQLYANNRLICGVHFRSDIVAGQTLGTAVAVELLENPDFRKDMAAARDELVKAGVVKPQ